MPIIQPISDSRNKANSPIESLAAENLSAANPVVNQVEKQWQGLQKHPGLGRWPADTNLARMGYQDSVAGDHLFSTKRAGRRAGVPNHPWS